MKLCICSLIATVTLTSTAYAANETQISQENNEPDIVVMVESVLSSSSQMPASCTAMKLDDSQMAALQQAHFDYAKQRNTLVATIKNAWLDVNHMFMSKDSTKEQGMNSLMAVKTSENALFDAAGMLGLKVFYDILKPEQRMGAWMCMKDLEKMKRENILRKMCAMLPPVPPTQGAN
ncbi:MAG: hypothetical protein ACXVCY_05915 [Pseudobdellovibrionaceae bacterium]